MLRIGLFADLHYASGIRERTRYCHLGIEKLRVALQSFRAAGVSIVVGLGDLVDSAETPAEELALMQAVVGEVKTLGKPAQFVPGNHCVWTLTKSEFLAATGQTRTWGSLQQGGWRLVFLDACFRSDGSDYGRRNADWRDANISGEQIAWLKGELATPLPTAVFVHQRLDALPPYGVTNAAEVRALLESSGCVKLVVQGHEHSGARSEIGGIPYITLPAMVEGESLQPTKAAILGLHAAGGWQMKPAE